MKTFCNYYNQGICHSCTRIEDDYSSQVKVKSEKLQNLLEVLGPFVMLAPGTSAQEKFRNKAKLSITGTIDNPIIGLTGEKDLDLGRSIPNCSLHHPAINHLISSLPEFIKLTNLAPYQIAQKKGELKGVIIYFSSGTEELYLRLVLRSKESLDRIKKHAHTLLVRFPKLTSLSANIQPIAHAILEGEEEIFFTEQQFIKHRIKHIDMTLHPQGFVQTNQAVAGELYETAAEWIKEISSQKFLELFSGQGAFSFFIQKYVKLALGVEINPEAVARANSTAQAMGWNHLNFLTADAASISNLMKDFNPDCILVNPPRRGLGQALSIIQKSGARYFIYSSCNAETLAHDLQQLQDRFKVVKVKLFDMFPNSDHFETLVLLKSTSAY